MRSKNSNPWILMLLLLVGLVIGGVIGNIFSQYVGFLGYSQSIGFEEPFVLNLSVIKLTLGFMMEINVASVIGLVISIFIFNKI